MDGNGAFDLHQTCNQNRPRDFHQMAMTLPDLLSLRRRVEISGAPRHAIGRLGRFVEEIHDPGAIEPQSRCDRAAIMAPSSWNQCHDSSNTWCTIPIEDGRQKVHDRSPINTRSWPDHRLIVATIKANSPPTLEP